MSTVKAKSAAVHLCGSDLEVWRLENALSKSEAADAFGLRRGTWDELVSPAQSQRVISDPAVAMLLYLYRVHPETAPVSVRPKVSDFYEFLGFEDSPQHREDFAILIGRSKPTVYRLLNENGTPGRPIVRWIEAVRRMGLTSKQSRNLMSDIASKVGEQHGIENVSTRGWTQRAGERESDKG
jgi:hypothetical protein